MSIPRSLRISAKFSSVSGVMPTRGVVGGGNMAAAGSTGLPNVSSQSNTAFSGDAVVTSNGGAMDAGTATSVLRLLFSFSHLVQGYSVVSAGVGGGEGVVAVLFI